MTQLALVDAYQAFMASAHQYVQIQNEADYQGALAAVEDIMESAADTLDDPLNPLIDMLAHAINQYEAREIAVVEFLDEAERIPTDVALLKELMKQHDLVGSDLPEIGDKTMVSKVLNGKRLLTRRSIERLAERFHIQPSVFLS